MPQSGKSLPAVRPFRPATEDITQVILISNKDKTNFDMTCIISYCLPNDPDPCKESCILKDIPCI